MQGSSPQGANYESKKFYFDFCGVGMFLRLVRDYGTSRKRFGRTFVYTGLKSVSPALKTR